MSDIIRAAVENLEIENTIARHNIPNGQPMRDAQGAEIEGTVVLDAYTFMWLSDDEFEAYRVRSESPLGPGIFEDRMSREAMATLRASTI